MKLLIPSKRRDGEMDVDALQSEVRALQEQVAEVIGAALVSVDGMPITAVELDGAALEGLAALAAAFLAVAQRVAHEVSRGDFCETVIRCEAGYVAFYAAGPRLLLVVLTEQGLNLARLHMEARTSVKRITTLVDASGALKSEPRKQPSTKRK
ncbi:roadblock/LC7 domain-containing protein [Streptomyces sp. NPDC048290]|uniref:roadblock/LC7 domain-containing protein n=1 Tax=Streptomyces sp. NPDC048290 TaxID=3155811 RepID=UPI003413887D